MAYEVLIKKVSDTGTRTQVARVKAEYPNQLDYIGYSICLRGFVYFGVLKCRSYKFSDTGTRTQVARVKAEYPNQLDYIGLPQ